MTYRCVTTNVKAPGTAKQNRETIAIASAQADVLKMQEVNEATSRTQIDRMPNFEHYHPTGLPSANAILWRKGVMRPFGKPGWKKIYANMPNNFDGPDRTMLWQPLIEVSTGLPVLEICLHMVAKAWTTAPDRQPGWLESAKIIGQTCTELLELYPGVPQVISADWNRRQAFDIPNLLESEVASLPTFGNVRYDRHFLVGAIQGTDPQVIPTKSDHDSLKIRVTLIPPPVKKTNRVEEWRQAVELTKTLPFPSRKERPEANDMRDATYKPLETGPKS